MYTACQKSNPLEKIQYLWNRSKFLLPNLQCLLKRILATHPANFIAIFGQMVTLKNYDYLK